MPPAPITADGAAPSDFRAPAAPALGAQEQDLVFEARREGGLFAQPSPALELLRRARREGLSSRALGQALQDSRGLEELAAGFSARGLLKPGEYDPKDPGQADAFRRAVERIWHEASPGLPGAWPVDHGWEVPALLVETLERTYYIHGVAHGFLFPLRARDARRLVARLRQAGVPLYSEQDFPLHYGYGYGWELKDRDAPPGQAAAVGSPLVIPAAARAAAATLKAAFWAAAIALPAAAVIQAPESLLSWAWLVLTAAFCALARSAFLPIYRLYFHALGLWAGLTGEKDLGRLLRARAEALFGGPWNPARLRFLELPQPLKAAARPGVSLRSLSQAKAVFTHARGRGQREVHVLDGYNHAQDLAWALRSLEGAREAP